MVRHRYRGGLLVIGLVVILVAVTTGLRAHVVAGVGRSAPVPGPPAVGDCVLDPLVPGSPLELADVTATSGGTVPRYPTQQIHSCTGTRYGEVVAVLPSPSPVLVKVDDAGGRYLDDSNADGCMTTASHYVGMTTPPVLHFWQVYLAFTTTLSRPSERQESAGQQWAACIVAPQYFSPALEQYPGSIRDAAHTGSQRNRLGNCVASADVNGENGPDDCGRPHARQFFAFGSTGAEVVDRTEIESTCRQLVGQVTAIPDLTAGGALSLVVQIQDDNGTAIDTAEVPTHSDMSCGVAAVGTRSLTSSLLAWGDRPLPWG